MDGVKGTFRGVMSDIDRITKDGVTDLGTMSFQQFKPVGTTVSGCHSICFLSVCNILCLAVPCCAALRCAVLCCAVLCCAVLRHVLHTA